MNSHPKLGAFDHASFIFKKKKKKEIFIKKIKQINQQRF